MEDDDGSGGTRVAQLAKFQLRRGEDRSGFSVQPRLAFALQTTGAVACLADLSEERVVVVHLTTPPASVARRSGWEDSDNQDENSGVAAHA